MIALEKETIARDMFWYTSSVYMAQALGLFSGILTRRFLDPPQMGMWVLLQTFLNYGLFVELGVLTAMYCRIPVHEGKKDKAAVRRTYNSAFTFSFIGALAVMAAFMVYAVMSIGRIGVTAAGGFAVTGILVVLTIVYNFYVNLLWSLNRFRWLGRVVVLNAVLTIILVYGLVKPFGLYGLYLSTCILTIISGIAAYFHLRIIPSLIFDWKAIWELLKFGLPIYAGGMLFTMLLSLDKFMIVKFLGAQALGFYSIAAVLFSFASTAPKMFSIVLFPRMQETYSASGSLEKITRMVIKPDLVIAFLSPLLLGLAYFLTPFLVSSVLHKYVSGIRSAQILLLGSFFVSLIYNVQSFLITIGKRIHVIPFLLLALATGIWVNFRLIKARLGIEGVAVGMSVAFFVYFLSITYYTLRHFLSWHRVLMYLFEIISVFTYFLFWIWRLDRQPVSRSTAASLMAQCALYFLASLPVLFWAEKRTSVLSYSFQIIRKRFIKTPAA